MTSTLTSPTDTEAPTPRTRGLAVAKIAAEFASDVDSRSRFPVEAVDEMRKQGLLGAPVPTDRGGLGYGVRELGEALRVVASACSSSALILAMHYSQLLCLVRSADTDALRTLRDRCAVEQLLIASATTEINIGGDTRSSGCAVRPAAEPGFVHLAKTTPVISYGEHADLLFATARRNDESGASDQVLVAAEPSQFTLRRTTEWDTMGMRGTCSHGFEMSCVVPEDQVFRRSYGDLSAESMLPGAHTMWASAWLGMANEAARVARAFVQKAARKTPGVVPPSALRLAELEIEVQAMNDMVASEITRYEAALEDPALLGSMQFAIAMNTLKVSSSRRVHRIVTDAMVIIGIQGYSNRTPFSIARIYRDAMAPSVMVNNDRILKNTAGLELVARGER